MKDKTIIGLGYVPGNAKAICLKTDSETTLGDTEYTIIADPYAREFTREPSGLVFSCGPLPKEAYTALAVNLLDSVTGLTYAVEYAPANLVRKPVEYSWEDIKMHLPKGMRIAPINEVPDKKPFAERARQIIEELNEIFNNGGISEKCGVAFFSISDNGDGKTSLAHSFLGGRGDRIIDCIATCAENPNAVELVTKGVMKATLRIMAGVGKNKDDNE